MRLNRLIQSHLCCAERCVAFGVAPFSFCLCQIKHARQCYSLRPVCEESTRDEVCNDQCEECFRALTFALEWDDKNSDMDLRVTEPDGTEIPWYNREGVSIAGGWAAQVVRVYIRLYTLTSRMLLRRYNTFLGLIMYPDRSCIARVAK